MKSVILSVVVLFVSSAFAGAPNQITPIKPKGPAEITCENIHGTKNVDLIEVCVESYNAFLSQQAYLGVAEKVKAASQDVKNKNAIKKMTDLATAIILQAKDASVLITQGATAPNFAFNSGVSSEWGVICSSALDYSVGDEDPATISNLYTCEVASGVYIEYAETNCAEDAVGLKHEVKELKVKFNVKPNGQILEDSISTEKLVENKSCAG